MNTLSTTSCDSVSSNSSSTCTVSDAPMASTSSHTMRDRTMRRIGAGQVAVQRLGAALAGLVLGFGALQDVECVVDRQDPQDPIFRIDHRQREAAAIRHPSGRHLSRFGGQRPIRLLGQLGHQSVGLRRQQVAETDHPDQALAPSLTAIV